jgi:hypothetical protein
MRRRVEVVGPASAAAMWAAYADTSRWSTWAPHITRVEPRGPLVEGMRGVVHGPLWARATFDVARVDEEAGTWGWTVRVGPARLRIDHEVGDGRTAIVVDGAAPLVLAYEPVARIALRRLVALPEPGQPASTR